MRTHNQEHTKANRSIDGQNPTARPHTRRHLPSRRCRRQPSCCSIYSASPTIVPSS